MLNEQPESNPRPPEIRTPKDLKLAIESGQLGGQQEMSPSEEQKEARLNFEQAMVFELALIAKEFEAHGENKQMALERRHQAWDTARGARMMMHLIAGRNPTVKVPENGGRS